MQPHLHTGRLKTFNIWPLLMGFIILALTFYLTDLYLKLNFKHDGEAYMKGAGHLLQEDYWKAILFFTTRHLIVSISCSYLFFYLVGKENGRQLFKMLRYICFAVAVLTIGYTLYMVNNIVTDNYDRKYRIIEIALKWFLRVGGFFVGYKLAMNVFKISSKHIHIN